MQSQEQEINQHQQRYRDLEAKLQSDVRAQEAKFAQMNDKVQQLLKTTKAAKSERESANQHVERMQAQLELVQENDDGQRKEIVLLQMKVQQREQEVSEVVKSFKQVLEASKQLEEENEQLRLEIERTSGHNNPNQKIQLHQKIKEENNRLKAEIIHLREDLHSKFEMIQRYQREKPEAVPSRESKIENKIKKEFDQIINLVASLPQFERLAKKNNMSLEIGGSHSFQKALELLALADDELDYYPIPNPKMGAFRWLDETLYFVGIEGPTGWVESGDFAVVFYSDGTTEPLALEIADGDDEHLTLEVEALLERVRVREGGARS